MKKINLFCFGFGQVAKQFVKKILLENQMLELNTSTRKEKTSEVYNGLNFAKYKFDGRNIDEKIKKKIQSASHVLISIPPTSGEEVVVKYFKEILRETKCSWITYLSATSVYGNHQGEWVDENSETNPSNITGINRLKAEKIWLQLAKEFNLPLQIFRLSGIYSNEHNILKRLRNEKVQLIKKKNHFFSRIHLDDIANILFQSLNKFKPYEIYNISDDKPAPQEEVIKYGSKLLNINIPKITEINDLESEMLKNFFRDSKKVKNNKMKEFFNYKLKYPTYIEGLNYIFNNTI